MPEQTANNPAASEALKGVYEAYITPEAVEEERAGAQPVQPHVEASRLGANVMTAAAHEVPESKPASPTEHAAAVRNIGKKLAEFRSQKSQSGKAGRKSA